MNSSLKRWFGKRSKLYKNFNDPVSYIPLLVRFTTARYFHKNPDLLDFIAGPYDKNISDDLLAQFWQTVNAFFSSPALANEYAQTDDPYGMIYQDLISKKERLELGEFYTPFPLANRLTKDLVARFFQSKFSISHDSLFSDDLKCNVTSLPVFPQILDPTCGSGVFLTATLRLLRLKEKYLSPEKQLTYLTGFDLNPLAIVMTRGNLLRELFKNDSAVDQLHGNQSDNNKSDSKYIKNPSDLDSLDIFIANSQKKDPFSVFLFDSLLGHAPKSGSFRYPQNDRPTQFDLVLGNPPWICWDQLSGETRSATLSLWRHYGLFDLSGKEARYGGGKKDLAGLMFYIAADYFLKKDGFLSMIIPISLLRSDRAGQGFRRFQIGTDGPSLGLLEINDYSQCSLFHGVQSFFSSVVIQKNKKTQYPVSCNLWSGNDLELHEIRSLSPINPTDPVSPLLFQISSDDHCLIESPNEKNHPNKTLSNERKTRSIPVNVQLRLGDAKDEFSKRTNAKNNEAVSENQNDKATLSGSAPQKTEQYYRAQLGANTAGANGIFWFSQNTNIIDENSKLVKVSNLGECGKKKVMTVEPLLEKSLLYPLIRWRDVQQFQAVSSGQILIVQDPQSRQGIPLEIMKQLYPHALNYLCQFEDLLKNRAAYRKFQSKAPYWSMYNINEATLSPIKVIWRRMDWKMNAAVLLPDNSGKPLIPQETLSMISISSIEEADYLVTLLNSNTIGKKIAAICQPGTKSFGNPNILKFLDIEKYNPLNKKHIELSIYGFNKRKSKQ